MSSSMIVTEIRITKPSQGTELMRMLLKDQRNKLGTSSGGCLFLEGMLGEFMFLSGINIIAFFDRLLVKLSDTSFYTGNLDQKIELLYSKPHKKILRWSNAAPYRPTWLILYTKQGTAVELHVREIEDPKDIDEARKGSFKSKYLDVRDPGYIYSVCMFKSVGSQFDEDRHHRYAFYNQFKQLQMEILAMNRTIDADSKK